MTKSIKILLCISGILTIYTFTAISIGTRIAYPFKVPYAVIMFFLFDFAPHSIYFLYFFILFMFTPVLAVTDFLCAYYIDKKPNITSRIASYRSLITCLFGVFPFFVGLFVFRPIHLQSKLTTIEGVFYFLFYGTLFYLLMLSERKNRQA